MRRPCALALSCALVTCAAPAFAQRSPHRFEPTDLDLQEPGLLNLDLQFGAVQSRGPARIVTPDFELNLGLSKNVELDLDGAFGLEGPAKGSFSIDHATSDNLWLSAKLGLFSFHDDAAKKSWALGLQIGPKFPTAPDARGAGYEALLLIGRSTGRVHLVLNAGALVDPGRQVSKDRPIGFETGLDLNVDLNEADTFSILGELGGVAYFTNDPHDLTSSLGLQWSPSERLDLSLVGLVGFLPGSDRYGVLLGASPKFRLW